MRNGPCRAAHCSSMMVLASAISPLLIMAGAARKGMSTTVMSSPSSATPRGVTEEGVA